MSSLNYGCVTICKQVLPYEKNSKTIVSFFVWINPLDDMFRDFCYSWGLSSGLHVRYQLLAYGREPEYSRVRNLLVGLPAEMPEQQ